MKERNGLLIGNVVKFYTKDGRLNGGTIVEFVTQDDVRYACLNTLDGERVRVKVKDLIVIKHQRKTEASENFKRRIRKEITEHNKQQTNTAVSVTSEIGETTNNSNKDIQDRQELLERMKQLEYENTQLRVEKEELQKKLDSIPNGTTEERLSNTILALKKSILSGMIFPDDKSQAIIPLLDIITELNGIKHEPLI